LIRHDTRTALLRTDLGRHGFIERGVIHVAAGIAAVERSGVELVQLTARTRRVILPSRTWRSPVWKVAQRVGYESLNSFSGAFKA
jgi:hypothetical protein